MNGKEECKSFLKYLVASGELNEEACSAFQHYLDMELKCTLINIRILTPEHGRLLWTKYIYEKKFHCKGDPS